MTGRTITPLDRILAGADNALRTLFAPVPSAARPSPARDMDEPLAGGQDKLRAAALMRVNHAGEVAAQALYQGHALTARSEVTRRRMEQSAAEEIDHLAWCRQRIEELGGRTSLLNPAWYAGSLAIGVVAGLAGDKWNLGFVAETERQVIRHIDDHLQRLPAADSKSIAILEQMREDEARHATLAIDSGAAEFPPLVKRLMTLTSKLMTTTAERI